ncbi:MAG: PQQ-binding-like beta-propeller repeat protein [Bacillota bacterium]
MGLFFLAVFAFVALAQKPWSSSGWRGLLPTPSAATPVWTRAVGPRATMTADGDGVALLTATDGGSILIRLGPDGALRQQGDAQGAALIVGTRDRPMVLRADPPATGRLQAGGLTWTPIDLGAAQGTPASAFGRGGTILVLAGPPGGTSPAGKLLCLTPDGRKQWEVDEADRVITAVDAGGQGSFAVASFLPGVQPLASAGILSGDGTLKGPFDLGPDPVFRTYLNPTEDAILALDATHAWLIDTKSGSTRSIAVEAPVTGGFALGGEVHVATEKGLVLSIDRGGQTTWRRQLAGAPVDLVELSSGGLLVLGEDRLYALDASGRGTWTLALTDAPKQVVVPPAGDQVVVLTASKLAAYRLPSISKAGP